RQAPHVQRPDWAGHDASVRKAGSHMAKENPETGEKKPKNDNSAFQKFDALAKRVIRVPKDKAASRKSS
ncbi:MAG TPA: hypothetical protein VMM36_15790, partial [Opitutaceae bacterium]|nr:hypothetical protein [Opitutaceae bacterium]